MGRKIILKEWQFSGDRTLEPFPHSIQFRAFPLYKYAAGEKRAKLRRFPQKRPRKSAMKKRKNREQSGQKDCSKIQTTERSSFFSHENEHFTTAKISSYTLFGSHETCVFICKYSLRQVFHTFNASFESTIDQ